MPTVREHYDSLLSDAYSWMLGGFAAGVERNAAFFDRLGIRPAGSRVAVDLGAGSGFQSIPLARLGFSVTAIDLDGKLLAELRANAAGESIRTIEGDLLDFARYVDAPVELAVCMQDTLLHLESKADVRRLFRDLFEALEPAGRFVITYRDLSRELTELDRFIPVRSDAERILTCFLEYEPETVNVHDLLYRRDAAGWSFKKSYYRKLRLSPDWVADELASAGFGAVDSNVEKGFVTMIARKG
ncbi:MAG TPA: class I SAM-dependent methyltransferase [Gammaproteobacteria bacterium]|nr:class I SAM-dependent methyltransferase [Gammaproteobacteria bacterium]